jgi:hypothetical protein
MFLGHYTGPTSLVCLQREPLLAAKVCGIAFHDGHNPGFQGEQSQTVQPTSRLAVQGQVRAGPRLVTTT